MSNKSSKLGIAVISLDFSSTFIWTIDKPISPIKADTIYGIFLLLILSVALFIDLPSILIFLPDLL